MILYNDVISEIGRCPVCQAGIEVSGEKVRCSLERGHFIAFSLRFFNGEPDIVDEVRILLPNTGVAIFFHRRETRVWRNIQSGITCSDSDIWALMRLER